MPLLLLYEVSSIVLKAVSKGVLGIDDAIEAVNTLKYISIDIHLTKWEDSPRFGDSLQKQAYCVRLNLSSSLKED